MTSLHLQNRAVLSSFLAVSLASAVACGGDAEVKKEDPVAIKHRAPPDEPWRKEKPKSGAESTVAFPTFVRETLPNGLTLFVVEEHALPIVDVRVVVHAGSALDSAKTTGLVSLAYDMLDEGAGSMGSAELAEAFAKLGTSVRIGADREAGGVAVGLLKRHLPVGFDLLSQVVLKPTFDKDRFEKVRAERLSSITQRLGEPMSLAFETLAQAAFGPEHAYGLVALGTTETVEKMKVADVKKFWTDQVGPANTAIVFAGDITLDEAKKLVDQYFGKWKNKAKRPVAPKDPTTTKPLIHLVKGPAGSPQTVLALGRPFIAHGDADETPAEVMNQILGGMFSSRLNMKLREEKRWTYGAWSRVDPRLGRGPFMAGASVVADQTVPALQETLAVLEALTTAPVTDEELALAKSNLVKSLPSKLETIGALGGAAAELYLYNLPLDHYATRAAAWNAVTKENVQEVAKRALAKDGLTIVLVGDADKLAEPLKALGEVSLVEPGAVPAR
jgi:zinc protease